VPRYCRRGGTRARTPPRPGGDGERWAGAASRWASVALLAPAEASRRRPAASVRVAAPPPVPPACRAEPGVRQTPAGTVGPCRGRRRYSAGVRDRPSATRAGPVPGPGCRRAARWRARPHSASRSPAPRRPPRRCPPNRRPSPDPADRGRCSAGRCDPASPEGLRWSLPPVLAGWSLVRDISVRSPLERSFTHSETAFRLLAERLEVPATRDACGSPPADEKRFGVHELQHEAEARQSRRVALAGAPSQGPSGNGRSARGGAHRGPGPRLQRPGNRGARSEIGALGQARAAVLGENPRGGRQSR